MTDYSPTGGQARFAATLATGVIVALSLAACSPASTGTKDPSAPPSSTPPARSVSATNLLTVEDVEGMNDDPMTKQVVEAPEGQGRPVSQSYICLPENGLGSLGATSMVTRNFTLKIINGENDPYPKSPLKNKPSVYTQALQFSDAAAATAARATYAGWIKGCATTLFDRGYGVAKDQGVPVTTVHVEGAKAQGGMVAYVEPGAKDNDNLYWESAGITQVKDRLMVTIAITWGEDTPGSFDQTEGDFINPVVTLMEPSVARLTA